MIFHHTITAFHQFFLETQRHLTHSLSLSEENRFHIQHKEKKYAYSSVALVEDDLIERGAINVSAICGQQLPEAASLRHPECLGHPFQVTGLSMIMHPANPHAPTMHANLRVFVGGPNQSIMWLGGGMDLTPCYVYHPDVIHWHQTIARHLEPFGQDLYPTFKSQCDKYFYLPHRQEHRGVGGIFFDDLSWPVDNARSFLQAMAICIEKAYRPILQKRHLSPYTEAQKSFQLMRRGRYVEFNLMYDRGTKFGLEFGSQPDQILVSLPPACWHYDFPITPGSHEALLADYLQPQDWLEMATL